MTRAAFPTTSTRRFAISLKLLFAIPLVGCIEAKGQTVGQQPDALVPLGALACEARKLRPNAEATELDCGLRLDTGATEARFTGEMRGKGLYIVYPGRVRVLWRVLASDPQTPLTALAGSYDASSDRSYAFVRENDNVLVGGNDDEVVLELLAPRVDAIGSETRLSLRRVN
jgi:hypothetical protein